MNTRRLWTILGINVVVVIVFAGSTYRASAATTASFDVSVSATVTAPTPPEEPETRVSFEGLAYPGVDLTFTQNGSAFATVPADPAGRFSVSKAVDPGTYTFTIIGTDADGREGPPFSISLTLAEGVTASITGIFLGPTIEADASSVELGDTITILGITVPESSVNLYVSSEEETTHTVTADADGLWSKVLIAGDDLLVPGTHEARSKATSPDDVVSEYSKTVTFDVMPTEEDPCSTSSPGDLNCDGSVNLVDFSILLYYWLQQDPANARADINDDGIVDVVDFSIQLFYWTG